MFTGSAYCEHAEDPLGFACLLGFFFGRLIYCSRADELIHTESARCKYLKGIPNDTVAASSVKVGLRQTAKLTSIQNCEGECQDRADLAGWARAKRCAR